MQHSIRQPAYLLTLLPTEPPKSEVALGTSSVLPPAPETLTVNPHFMQVLRSVVAENATSDPEVQAQAKAFASTAGAGLGSGGAFFAHPQKQQMLRRTGSTIDWPRDGTQRVEGDGAGGANAQGGIANAGRCGWVHVSDQRNPPDWGRIAWPEDILGSVQVDGRGDFVGPKGCFEWAGTYRVCTREGILGLSPFLRTKLIERLREIEKSL